MMVACTVFSPPTSSTNGGKYTPLNGCATQKRSDDHIALQSVGVGRVLDATITSAAACRLRWPASVASTAAVQDVLLDEIGLSRHHRPRSVVKVNLPLGGSGRWSARQRGFGVGHRAANPFLHPGFDVRRYRRFRVQRPCGPSAADDPGSKKPQCVHFHMILDPAGAAIFAML
jgi:hypothetical protein